MQNTQASSQKSFTKMITHWLPLALTIIFIPVSAAAFSMAIDAQGPDQYSLDDPTTADETLRRIEIAANQSEQNNQSVDNILSFIEGGSILIGGIIALLGFAFTLNIRDLRQDLESQAKSTQERVERTLTDREEDFKTLTANLQKTVEETRQQTADLAQLIERQLKEARATAENAFRVISFQILGEQQLRVHNYDTSIQILQQAYELDNNNPTTNYLLGYIYTARRKFALAQEHLERALKGSPNFAPALAALGLAQRRMGDQIKDDTPARNLLYAQAESNLLAALKIDAGLIDADGESYYGTLGGLYRRQHRYADAIYAYEQAVEITKNNSYPVNNLAVLYKQTGKDDKAAVTFEKAVEIAKVILDDRPSDIWARYDLAQGLLVLGRTEEAQKLYREIISSKPPVSSIQSHLSTLEVLATSPSPIKGIQDVIDVLNREEDRRQLETSQHAG